MDEKLRVNSKRNNVKCMRGLRFFFGRYRIEAVYDGALLSELYAHCIDRFYARDAVAFEEEYVEFDCQEIAKSLRTDALLIVRRLEYMNRQDSGHYEKDGQIITLFKENNQQGQKTYYINVPMLDIILAHRNAKVNQLVLPGLVGVVLGAFLSWILPMMFKAFGG